MTQTHYSTILSVFAAAFLAGCGDGNNKPDKPVESARPSDAVTAASPKMDTPTLAKYKEACTLFAKIHITPELANTADGGTLSLADLADELAALWDAATPAEREQIELYDAIALRRIGDRAGEHTEILRGHPQVRNQE